MKSVFITLFLAASLNADTLILRDGRRIDGQLVFVQNGVLEFEQVQPPAGTRALRFNRDEVLGVEFDRNASRFSQNRTQGGRPAGLRERQVMVAATVKWVDTGTDVQSGQDVYFEATGEVVWGPSRRDGPAGEQNSPMNANRPIPTRPAAALIGRVGDNAADYFYIGVERGAIRMRSSGRLFLGVNDDYLQDNSGSFRVVVYH